MSFLYLKYRLQATIYNRKDYRVIFKRYFNSKTENLEYFNKWILLFRNTVTREIIQIVAEHELQVIEYKIQTQPGEKKRCLHTV